MDSFEIGAFADDHEEREQIAAIARERGSRFVGRDLSGEEVLVIGIPHWTSAVRAPLGPKLWRSQRAVLRWKN